jgi:hypothetical protein
MGSGADAVSSGNFSIWTSPRQAQTRHESSSASQGGAGGRELILAQHRAAQSAHIDLVRSMISDLISPSNPATCRGGELKSAKYRTHVSAPA